MKLVLHYWALILCASLSAAVAHHFIVELETRTTHNTHSFRRALDSVSSSLKRSSLKHEITRKFSADGIFHGFAVKLNDATDANIIAAIPRVKSIRPSSYYKAPRPIQMQIRNLKNASIPTGTESIFNMTGVDKVHKGGNVGKGVKVAIIDTGIDYNHPSLGGGFGSGFKVIGGYDFVGDNYTGTQTSQPVPGPDPLDTCNGHGTFVAGIIGASPGNEFNISGVAPGASLSAYRVFGCTGGTSEAVVMEAVLQAVKDENDIIVLSFSEPSGWTDSTLAVLVSRIANSGIVVTVEAGDNGASGSWSPQSPSTGINVISVASVDNTILPARNATVNGPTHAPIQYVSLFALNVTGALPIYATSKNTSVDDDACNSLPDSTPDLSGFLVVIRRGSNCSLEEKIANIEEKGGNFALIYNNDDSPLSLSIPVSDVSAGGINAADGVFLVQQFTAGVSTNLSFPQDNATNINDPHGGLVSNFSSYGPTFDLYFKPALSAPGGNIISTVPVDLGTFGMASGTAMATSFVAGSAALVLSAKGRTKQVANDILSLFESTAQKVPSSTNSSDPLQTLTQQGAGLINVYAAINTTTILSPTELHLNSTAHFVSVKSFTVKNSGTTAKSYTVKHVPAGTAITVQSKSIFPGNGPVPLSSNFASVEITPSSFTLQPGKTQTVTNKFRAPTGLDPTTFPVYSGFIEVYSGSESLHAVYHGMVGDLKTKQVFDNTSSVLGFQLPALINLDNDSPQAPSTNYTFKGADNPILVYRMVFGSPLLDIYLVDASVNTSSSPLSEKMVVGSILSNTSVPRNDLNFGQYGFPISVFDMKTATFLNGSTIPNGFYRFLFRAFRVTGDRALNQDYDYALSDSFGVQV